MGQNLEEQNSHDESLGARPFIAFIDEQKAVRFSWARKTAGFAFR